MSQYRDLTPEEEREARQHIGRCYSSGDQLEAELIDWADRTHPDQLKATALEIGAMPAGPIRSLALMALTRVLSKMTQRVVERGVPDGEVP